MSAVDERTIYAKLEAMKDIRYGRVGGGCEDLFKQTTVQYVFPFPACRSKTLQLEKLKLKIVREVENGDAEEKCLSEYRRELELLMQEKMSHVEELRQIHADINAVRAPRGR